MAIAQFTFRLDLCGHGWLRAVLSNGLQEVTLIASYIADAPSDLAEAVLSLLRSPHVETASCSWHDEPGQYRWVFHRTDMGISIEIRCFADCFSHLPNERGERIFMADCSLIRLATQVKGQMHRLLNEHGEQDYNALWQRPFPMHSFHQLEAQLDELKHNSAVKA